MMKTNNEFLFGILIVISQSLFAQNQVTFIPPEATPKIKIDTIVQVVDAAKNLKHFTILENDITTQDGYLMNNKKTGKWYIYYPNGVLLSMAEYDNGIKNGVYLECDKNGAVLVQENFKNDKLDGEQKKYFSAKTGRILKSSNSYKEGKFHGTCTEYSESGLIQSQVQYSNGKKDGATRWYFSNGKIAMEQFYSNEMLNGIQKIYNQQGILLSEGKFANNLKTGLWTEYYDSGKMKAQGNYTEDKKTGAWKLYDEAGNLSKTENF